MIHHGDCLEMMKSFPENHIDFICTDPPYMIGFMGKDFDKFKDNPAANPEVWKEVLRICKPGSMLAAFGGDRTHHHLMNALESAGWEIRTCCYWITGQGFPKSNNFGCKCKGLPVTQERRGQTCETCKGIIGFEGYGTTLKPAAEIIVLAMKPLDGTFAQNAEKWGVAGININNSRIIPSLEDAKSMERVNTPNSGRFKAGKFGSCGKDGFGDKSEPYDTKKGRWPANLILDEEAAQQLDQMTGILKSGASRFFYCSKCSASERQGSTHPTMKPIALMKYIIKLLAPPGDPLCLDPFCGSGSTLIAAKELGIRCIGIEKEEEYCEIARRRVAAVEPDLFQ